MGPEWEPSIDVSQGKFYFKNTWPRSPIFILLPLKSRISLKYGRDLITKLYFAFFLQEADSAISCDTCKNCSLCNLEEYKRSSESISELYYFGYFRSEVKKSDKTVQCDEFSIRLATQHATPSKSVIVNPANLGLQGYNSKSAPSILLEKCWRF